MLEDRAAASPGIHASTNASEIQQSLDCWRGYFVAMVTPFNPDLSLDKKGLAQLVHWHIEQGVHGIVVAGTTGEWFSLTVEERKELFTLVRSEVPKHVPLVAGCSAITIRETIDFMNHASRLDYQAALVTPPPYIVPTDEEIIAFYRTITQETSLPLIVYNWPLGVGRDMNSGLLRRLLEIKGVFAIKNSTSDLAEFLATARLLRGHCKLFGVMPSDFGIGILEHVGGDGCIGAAGVLGRDQPGFFQAVWDKDYGKARLLAERDHRLMTSLFHKFQGLYGNSPATFKQLLALQGLPAGRVRPPLLDLSDKAKDSVRSLAIELGLI